LAELADNVEHEVG